MSFKYLYYTGNATLLGAIDQDKTFGQPTDTVTSQSIMAALFILNILDHIQYKLKQKTAISLNLDFGPGGLRAPWVLACAMRSLAIVITIVQSLSQRSVTAAWATRSP